MTTLLALFRRPDGGDEALAEFERAYAETHLPLVVETPGLRASAASGWSRVSAARRTSS